MRESGSVEPDTLDAIVARLVSRFHPVRVVLFGSQATGSATPNSDVDLLVIMPVTGKRLDLAVEIRKELRGLGIAKDIVVMTPEEFEAQRHTPGTIAFPAARDGQVLYAA